MNYAAIDLDIDNYDDEDLESFFGLLPVQQVPNLVQPMNTFPTETAPGILNKLRRRTRVMSLAMNTIFRDSNSVSATDCFFTLSYTLKNVVGIRLLSIE
ncbi:MAG: hypothetical protein EBY20_02630, partial [Alphaproteobacteria bacterium]|nr:hypothetical protein [Alphaproteobacteria bacterium]